MQEQMSVAQAARHLNVSRRTIQRWADSGQLRAERTPIGRLIDGSDVRARVITRRPSALCCNGSEICGNRVTGYHG